MNNKLQGCSINCLYKACLIMAQESNVIIINKVLQDCQVGHFADLADQPALFCKVFKEIFHRMKQTLMSCSEEKLPTPTLIVIKEDLFRLTDELFQYYSTDDSQLRYPHRRIDTLYPLNDLIKIVDAARTELIVAINQRNVSSPVRSRRIQNCRDKIFEALDEIREFEHRRT